MLQMLVIVLQVEGIVYCDPIDQIRGPNLIGQPIFCGICLTRRATPTSQRILDVAMRLFLCQTMKFLYGLAFNPPGFSVSKHKVVCRVHWSLDASTFIWIRSEERRVGKECRSGLWMYQ